MSIASSLRLLNRLPARSNVYNFSSGSLGHDGRRSILAITSSLRSASSTSSGLESGTREGSSNVLSEGQLLSAPSNDLDKHEPDSYEIDELTTKSTTHSSFPPSSSPPPSSSSRPAPSTPPPAPQPSSPLPPSAPPPFPSSSSPPPRPSVPQPSLTPSFSPFNLHPLSQPTAPFHESGNIKPVPSAPPPNRTPSINLESTNGSSASRSSHEPLSPKSIAQQLIDRQNDPVAIRRLANWLMRDRQREKDFKDWGLICRMCPPDLTIRMLSSPHAYGLKPWQKLPIASNQVYNLRSVISKLVLSHPKPTASSFSTSVAEPVSYNLMHDPNKMIPLLNQFLKLSEFHLPGDPYNLLLALRAYASFPGIGDSGRAKVLDLIRANEASWWTDSSSTVVDHDLEGTSATSLDTSLKSQRFGDVNRHRLTDLDAWTILKQVDQLRLITDLGLDVCSSWDRQPVSAPLRNQRLRLLRPLQQLERLSDAPSISDQSSSASSFESETASRPAIVPYEQIARFVTPALYQAPTDPIVLLFSMYLLYLTSVPGEALLRTLSAQALSPNGVEREVRGGFDSTKEMSETYRLVRKAIGVLKDVWGEDERAVWEVIKEDLRSQVIEAEKLRHDRARGKVGSLKRMS